MPPVAAEIFGKMSGETSSRGLSALYILRLGKYYYFLLSHSSRRCLHSLSVPATQENNSPLVWR